MAREDISQAAIYEIAKILWEHNDELVKRPGLMEWKRERFVTEEPMMPYHDGAIKFFKEKGLWTKEMEAFQKARLAEWPG